MKKEPKFRYETCSTGHELLAMVRQDADRAGDHTERERAISNGVDSLRRTVIQGPKKELPFENVEAGKKGDFVVLPEGLFQDKATAAIEMTLVRSIFDCF